MHLTEQQLSSFAPYICSDSATRKYPHSDKLFQTPKIPLDHTEIFHIA